MNVLHSLFFHSLLYLCTSLDLGQVHVVFACDITTFRDRSCGGGVFLYAVLSGMQPHSVNQLWDLRVCLTVYSKWDFIVSSSFQLLTGFVQPRGSEPKKGNNVTVQLHVTCPVLDITHCILWALLEP